jgi:hypothetical protein
MSSDSCCNRVDEPLVNYASSAGSRSLQQIAGSGQLREEPKTSCAVSSVLQEASRPLAKRHIELGERLRHH